MRLRAGAVYLRDIVEKVAEKHARQLWGDGWGLARTFVAALNIATRGFFWWSVPTQVSRYYERITDLEVNQDCIVERQPILKINWGNRILSRNDLRNTARCLAAMARMGNEEHPSLESYIGGLTLLSKNDIHLQVEQNAFDAFYRSLKEAMREFGGWDGTGDYTVLFQNRLTLHFSSEELRSKYKDLATAAEARIAGQSHSTPITLTDVAVMKIVTDGYLHEVLFRVMHGSEEIATNAEPQSSG